MWAGMVPRESFPELRSFAHHTAVSVQNAKAITDLSQPFHLPMSGSTFRQLELLLDALETNANSDENDNWTYIWVLLFIHRLRLTRG